ncbi:MAG: hypothetical protein MJA29_09555, partial [Candidatus Omnitrophica bacterium]|nr:hypothetical protein [Candidatus Omnitrophota bacterium]
RGLKAFFKLTKSFSGENPNPKTLLHMFDHIIKPILLYGSEIWGTFNPVSSKIRRASSFQVDKGFEGIPAEKLHLKFCKYALKVRKNVTNNAVYGELGRHPLYLPILKNCIAYWQRLELAEDNSLLKHALTENKNQHAKGIQSWYSFIHFILKHYDLSLYLDNPESSSLATLIESLSNQIFEENILKWKTEISSDYGKSGSGSGNKLRSYKLFKSQFELENYLLCIKDSNARRTLTNFRISAHDLAIERGRYLKTPLEDRLCVFCDEGAVEDEIHFLLECSNYNGLRKEFFSKVENKCKNFSALTSKNKFIWLLSNDDPDICNLLAEFITRCFMFRKNTRQD